MKTQLWVKWLTGDPHKISRIRQRFGIPDYTTVNGLSPAEIEPDDMQLLSETAKRGYISMIFGKWSKNSEVFTFISR